ncbi:MAG: citrate lyase holo-[acyl-carrier protein] synthase [Oscillospiraceae bacterium]|nr:citrate lyase holo-[acyl-carrier protein] synthase [Oscillospiraceae bacterium]
MNTAEVTLAEVLDFRDRRLLLQREILSLHPGTLVSFTMNIAGPVKRSPLGDLLFFDTVQRLHAQLGEPVEERILSERAGNEALLSYGCDPEPIKALCLTIEEESPAGRLLDIDVLNSDGAKLSRPSERRCLVCGGPVAPCARSRAHSLAEITSRTEELLLSYACSTVAELAVQALLDEVRLTPKPGLVDAANSGAHRDMDLALMEISAKSLLPYFTRSVELGYRLGNGCAEALQQAGLQAEQTMFSATCGVNTHQGAVFSMGLLCAGAGMALKLGTGSVRSHAAAIASGLRFIERSSHGESVLTEPQKGGARWEALSAFPHIGPALEAFSEHRSSLHALLRIIATVEDTNVLYRGGEDGLRFIHKRAQELLLLPDGELPCAIRNFDEECILRHLSPGGAADLFACALFLRSFAARSRLAP